MTYPQAIQYLESFINYEKIPIYPYKESLKLERVKDFLNIIDNPQDNLNCIHIAGTKGKGSTCAFITYILRQAGYKVGLYTSPHLSDFRERIRILEPETLTSYPKLDFEGLITYDELTHLVERLKPAIQTYNRNSQYGPLSFFEIYTSLAFVYFQEKKVDFAVLETGLGGRLDATNVVNPLVVAITPISYEHTQKLGNTLREIATEKAGIIKVRQFPPEADQPLAEASEPVSQFENNNRQTGKWFDKLTIPRTIPSRVEGPANRQTSFVISAPQADEAMEVIRERCSAVGAKLYVVDKDILCEKTRNGFSVKGIFGEYKDLKIRLLGRHQLINATVAVGVMEALRYYNIRVGIDSIRQGLYNTIWPGRCEVVSSNPLTVLDGAQNIASIKALKETIKENFSAESAVGGEGGRYKRLILVLGISNDKDIKGICQELYDLADEIILTKANNPRATRPKKLAEYFSGKQVYLTASVKEAKRKALSLAGRDDLILATGSLFVVGEFRDGSQLKAKVSPVGGHFKIGLRTVPENVGEFRNVKIRSQ